MAEVTQETIDQALVRLQSAMDAALSGMANDRHVDRLALDRPLLANLSKTLPIDLVVNDAGGAMLVYEGPLPDYVWWAEFDPEIAQLYLVTVGGQIMDFGQKLHPDVQKFLKKVNVLQLVQIDAKGKPVDATHRKLVIRKQGV